MNISDSDVFYNCSLPWFGFMYQYKFSFNSSSTFSNIIQHIFLDQEKIIFNVTNGTCYRFLTDCNHGLWPLCFDWRERCDVKIDCMNEKEDQQ